MLPNKMNLFIADIVSEITGEQTFWYVVGRTYESALRGFIKEANRSMERYLFYFYGASNEEVEDFVNENGNVKAGIYEC